MNDLAAAEIPEPFTPPDCDLRDFAFMPMDIVRLFGSRFHAIASDAEWRAGVTLWLKSFHQVPAASLPDDDVELCRIAELGRDLKTWRKVRNNALHGWVKCSDGRLYHPIVAEKANEAWGKKKVQRRRSAAGNAARWGNRDHSRDERGGREGSHEGSREGHQDSPYDVLEGSPQGSLRESLKDRKGQGQGQGYKGDPPKPPPEIADDGFERLWAVYPKREGGSPKKPAQQAYQRALKRGAKPDEILRAAETYASAMARAGKIGTPYVAQAATWLNQDRFGDDPGDVQPQAPPNGALRSTLQSSAILGALSAIREDIQ